MPEKICIDCKQPFTATSNRQLRCHDCADAHKNIPRTPGENEGTDINSEPEDDEAPRPISSIKGTWELRDHALSLLDLSGGERVTIEFDTYTIQIERNERNHE